MERGGYFYHVRALSRERFSCAWRSDFSLCLYSEIPVLERAKTPDSDGGVVEVEGADGAE